MNKNASVIYLVNHIENKELITEVLFSLLDEDISSENKAHHIQNACQRHGVRHCRSNTETFRVSASSDIAAVVTALLCGERTLARAFLKEIGFNHAISTNADIALYHAYILGILEMVLKYKQWNLSPAEAEEEIMKKFEYLVFERHGGAEFSGGQEGTLSSLVASIVDQEPIFTRRFLEMVWPRVQYVLTGVAEQIVQEFTVKVFNRLENGYRALVLVHALKIKEQSDLYDQSKVKEEQQLNLPDELSPIPVTDIPG